MEDIFFIILFVVFFLLLSFYLAFKEKGEDYMKLFAGVALLGLVWVGRADAAFGPKLMLTALASSSIWTGYTAIRTGK